MSEQNNADNPPKGAAAAADPTVMEIAAGQGQAQPPPNSPEQSMRDIATKYRYEVTTMSLIGLALGVCGLQTLATSSYCVLRLLVIPGVVLFTLFAAEWVHYFSDGLTHRKQAYFDVKNILETYQPRSYTVESLLFQPDPPTPDVSSSAPKKVVDSMVPHDQPMEGFEKWRKSHYEGEYERAMKAASSAPIYAGTEEQQQGAVTRGPMTDQIPAAKEELTERQNPVEPTEQQQNPDGQAPIEQQNPAAEERTHQASEGESKTADDATKNE